MGLKHIIEAWRDEEYRENLDDQMRMRLPENPAGEIVLAEEDLAEIEGGLDRRMPVPWPLSFSCLGGCCGTTL